MGWRPRTHLVRRKRQAFLIPYIAGCNFPDCSGPDQFLKVFPGVGMHFRTDLTDIRKESLSVKCTQPRFVQHQVIDRGVGKAEKHLVRYCFCQFIVFKQIRQQPVGVITADRAQNHISFRIPESRMAYGKSLTRS